jgi:hypothetical protein
VEKSDFDRLWIILPLFINRHQAGFSTALFDAQATVEYEFY